VRLALALALAAAPLGACTYLMTPAQSSASPEGVRLTVMNDECTFESNGESNMDMGLSDEPANLVVALRIVNGAPAPVVLHGDAIHLLGADGARLGPQRHGTEVVVPQGGRADVRIAFRAPVSLCCARGLALEASGGVTMESHPLALGPIDFEARCPL
jgi:hypothetical protein